jgi:starch synthase
VLKILHVASEIAPLSKTGGLGDVLAALPGALARLGCQITVVAPRYKGIVPEQHGLGRWLRTLPVSLGAETVEVGVLEGPLPGGGKGRLFLVDHPASFNRDGLYGHADDARRFTLLSRAALTLAAHFGAWPDIVHGHDWQTGPALLYAQGATGALVPPKRVLTIHNLAYQGRFPPSVVDALGFPPEGFSLGGYEFYGEVSFLKMGIVAADRLTTVSPRYAREIQTPEQGAGLDGLLATRAADLVGILNGADYAVWSPETDAHLAATYSSDRLAGKKTCKAALQREMGLPVRADVPLCGSISRLADQKGFDLICQALPKILEGEMQYVVLGTGDPGIEGALRDLAAANPKKVAVRIGYDDALAHRIEAGCDLFVMPSRYEPCGLNQLYSMRYGTPPIVRATGGLDDTVVDYEPRSRSGTGFKFEPYAADALIWAWQRALTAHTSAPDDFALLQKRGMAQDYSWDAAARKYAELYESLLSSA